MNEREGSAKKSTKYFNSALTPAELEAMDKAYKSKTPDNKPSIYTKAGQEVIWEYWGKTSKSSSGKQVFNLGARGRIWALCLIYRHASSPSEAFVLEDFARGAVERVKSQHLIDIIVRCEERRNKGGDLSNEGIEGFLKKRLKQLLSPTAKAITQPEGAGNAFLELMGHHVADMSLDLSGEDERQGFLAAIKKPASSPSELYRQVRDMLGLSEIKEFRHPLDPDSESENIDGDLLDRLDRLSTVDKALDRLVYNHKSGEDSRWHLADEDDQSDLIVPDLYSALEASGVAARQLVVLSGSQFVGKKTKICRLLRLIAVNHSGHMLMRLRGGNSESDLLPVCALSAGEKHYRQLIWDVQKFLASLAGTGGANAVSNFPVEQAASLGQTPLNQLLDEISQMHIKPALFIFTDVMPDHSDAVWNVVRDRGIKRLINTLITSNPKSKVLITSSGLNRNKDNNWHHTDLPPAKTIELSDPILNEIRRNILRRNMDHDFLGILLLNQNERMRGDVLFAFSALVNLSGGLNQEHKLVITDLLKKQRGMRHEEVVKIYELLVLEIEKQGLLAPVALIAASEDGLLDESLLALLQRWSKAVDGMAAPESAEEIRSKLEKLSRDADPTVDTGKERFLLRSKMVRYDPEEYEPNETHSASDMVWQFDFLIRAGLLDAIHSKNPALARAAHRLISEKAYRRALTKKVMSRSPISARATEESSRDIQCFVNLLASISLDKLPPANAELIDDLPLRHKETEVFRLSDKASDTRHAIRFALLCVLKEDVDRDFRLSMITDEDDLRLQLYLKFLQPTGKRQFSRIDPRLIPDSLPVHLSDPRFFSEEEVFGLFDSVALAAYHAQRRSVIEDIERLALEFARQRGLKDANRYMGRIWAAKVDAAILAGGLSDQERGHQSTLRYVKQLRKDEFGNLCEGLVDPRVHRSDEPLKSEIVIADLRLLARQAELSALTSIDRSEASRCYQLIEEVEAILARTSGNVEPAVLSGRMARRYIRFLFRDPRFRNLAGNRDQLSVEDRLEMQAIVEKSTRLINTNISRLRRFSGADRIGVMLDLARYKFSLGQLEDALQYAKAAYERASTGTISHGGRLDVLAVLCDLYILCAEQKANFGEIKNVDGHLVSAIQVAEELHSIAADLNYVPYRGISNYLHAKALLLQSKSKPKDASYIRNQLVQARELIDKAIEEMTLIEDCSFRRNMEDVSRSVLELIKTHTD